MLNFATIKQDFPLLDVVGRYIELQRKGNEYVSLCPFHADKNPSFSIYTGSDGTQRYRCFACGAGSEGGDVIDFICAIEQCDAAAAVQKLTGDSLPATGAKPKITMPPDISGQWQSLVPVPDDAPVYNPANTFNPQRGQFVNYRPTRLDTYRDANGRVLCHVVRLDFDDGAKICPTITYCEGPDGTRVWAAKRMLPPYPLMGLDDLAKNPKAHVLLVSGEKCRAEAAKNLESFVAVTWLGGDQAVSKADVRPLVGRFVTFWPDADASSRKSMMELYNMIERSGTG